MQLESRKIELTVEFASTRSIFYPGEGQMEAQRPLRLQAPDFTPCGSRKMIKCNSVRSLIFGPNLEKSASQSNLARFEVYFALPMGQMEAQRPLRCQGPDFTPCGFHKMMKCNSIRFLIFGPNLRKLRLQSNLARLEVYFTQFQGAVEAQRPLRDQAPILQHAGFTK